MNIVAIILGGGTGSRLQPLTTSRSKPAVSLAGSYRLIDVPMSNCINSGIHKIYVLTQYNSGSLHRHIQTTYHFDMFTNGYVQLLAAEQTPQSEEWFQGTADAVRQSLHHLDSAEPDLVVILSGDQLYRMDFRALIRSHRNCGGDGTICATVVNSNDAADLGILQGRENLVTGFVEKPGINGLSDDLLAPGHSAGYLASMGIYLFNYPVLRELLSTNGGADFGHHIIPEAIRRFRMCSYIHEGYWRDIGTIRSFWETHIELTQDEPPFCFYGKDQPVYTRPRFLPPSKLEQCTLNQCLIADGVVIRGAEIRRSVIGLRSRIGNGSRIHDSVIMGNDDYAYHDQDCQVGFGIGRNCRIENAIIDKNARLGDNVVLNPAGMEDVVTPDYTVRDGIIVIPKGAVLADNTCIGQ